MPPPIDHARLSAARRSVATLDREIAAMGRDVERLRRKRELASRTGTGGAELRELEAAERAAIAAHRERVHARGEAALALGGLIADVGDLVATDPGLAIGALPAAFPVALLPVRLETRFDGGTRLRVRIYPDQIHLDQHDEELTAGEAEIGRRYWRAVWTDEGAADTAWREAAVASQPERAAYLIDRLRPQNLENRASDVPPDFPAVATVDIRSPIRAAAQLLPTRWLIVLNDANGREIGRKWAPNFVPDRLAISPFGDLLAGPTENGGAEAAVDDAAKWMLDFDRAVEAGMALTIDETELAPGARFADGIGRLIAVGVDWTRTPQNAATALVEQLRAHGYSDGFELLAHGEASNNTASRTSHFQSRERDRAALFPARPQSAAPGDDASRLAAALGADPSAAGTLARFPGGRRAYDTTAGALQTALWGAAFGFYFAEVLEPILGAATVSSLRRHLQRHVRPAGPLPPLRVGRQPYGVLPVLSTPINFAASGRFDALPGRFEQQLAHALARIRTWVERPILQGISENTLAKLATMARVPAGRSPEDLLAEILKLGPVATRAEVRVALSEAVRESSDKRAQAAVAAHREIVSLVLANLGVPRGGLLLQNASGTLPKIFELVSPTRPRYVLNAIPWVAEAPLAADAVQKAVAKVRERIEEAVRDPERVRALLGVSSSSADTLLEGLLLVSAAFEYSKAAEEELRSPIYEAVFKGSMLAEMVGVERAPAEPAKLAIDTPRQMLQLQAAATNRSVLADMHSKIADLLDAALPDAKAFHAALETLAARPVEEVDHALRGVLDLGSHRLDAWITSVATRRLDALRASEPTGLHIGGYGFVHDLKPDVTPDSEGYIHVPSTDHAITAAVLRAGHVANRADKPDAFAIRLTSERVRNALYVSEGLAQGQRAGALLGYRFERWLVDGRLQAQYINAFRKLAPHPQDPTAAAGPQEAIAARDVVDGQRLAESWRDRRDALFAELAAAMPQPFATVPAADRGPLTVALDRLVDLFDAFLDLWTTESVHQLARGNRDRAAAALAVVDRQERPPEPLAVQTPRKCWGYVQRVMWTVPANATAPGWPKDWVSRTEPAANAIAARLLGPAKRFALAAHFVAEDGTVVGQAASLTLTKLGLSPLSLLLLSQPTGRDRPTRLEERVAAAFAAAADGLPAGAGIVLDPGPPPGAAEGAVGGGDLFALLDSTRAALFDRRALSAQSFLPAEGVVPRRAAADTVIARADALLAEMETCVARLDGALPAGAKPKRTSLKSALKRAAALVPVPFFALTPAFSAASDAELVAEGSAVRTTLTNLLQRASAIQPLDPAVEPGETADERATHVAEAKMQAAVERIRVVFGPAFPVLPPFSLTSEVTAEWNASLMEQKALQGGGASKLAVQQFLRAVSFVRDGTRAQLVAFDTAVLTGHAKAREGARVVQLPHVKGQRWAALPFDGPPPADVRMSAVLFGELAAAGTPMAGVLLDEWTEAVPEHATKTSLSFQYDAPAARPPQTIVLAVDAGIDGPGWTADALVATVNEMFDLARLRLLTPAQIAGHGAVLPTVFIPQNLSSEVASWDLLTKVRDVAAATSSVLTVLGKS